MAVPAQQPPVGGLGQVKPQTETPAANPAAAAARTSALEQAPEQEDFLATVVKDRQEAMKALNAQIEKLKSSLESRMNPPFDTSLMAAASGFLKPTRTGSFGESLGSAMEGYSTDANKVLERRAGIDKTNLELLQKQADLQKQNMIMQHEFGADKQFGGDPTLKTGVALAAPGSSTPPAMPQAGMPQPAMPPSQPGRPPLTLDRVRQAMAIDPAYGKRVEDQFKLEQSVEKQTQERYISTPQGIFDRQAGKYLDVTPTQPEAKEWDYGPAGKRATSPEVYKEYQGILKEPSSGERDQKLTDFYVRQNWLKPSAEKGTGQSGLPSTFLSDEAKAAQKELATKTAGERAVASEKMASRLGLQAEAAFENRNLAQDMIAYAKSNPRAFQLMQDATIKDSILRAIEQGVQIGNYGSISVPTRIIQQYKLDNSDIEALQMFAQKSAMLQTRGRQLNRTPGEGSTSDYETRMLGGIYALPTDTDRVVRLKSDALILQGNFDEERYKLWNKYSKDPSNSYNDFLVSDPYKELKLEYGKSLESMRQKNADLLAPKKVEPGKAETRSDSRMINGVEYVRGPNNSWVKK